MNDSRVRLTGHTGVAQLVLASVLSAALAIAGCALLLPDREPKILSRGEEITEIRVSTQRYSANKQITIVPVSDDSRLLVARMSGIVTENIFTGGILESGCAVMRVNDEPVVALHTEVPLYRDLMHGDQGADVRSLNRELSRLGRYEDDPESDLYTMKTQDALHRLFEDAGAADYDGSFLSLRSVVWLPERSVTVNAWQIRNGDALTPDMPVGTVPGRLERIELKNVAASAHDRILNIAGLSVDLPAGSTVINDRVTLDRLQADKRYQQEISAASGSVGQSGMASPTLTAALSLAEPITVLRVPAGAIFDLDGTTGCIAEGKRTIPVSIVGSELGVSLVSLTEGVDSSTQMPDYPETVDIGSVIAEKKCG